MIRLSCKNRDLNTIVSLTRSKSESNRALILRALYDGELEVLNLSDSDDTKVLQTALDGYKSQEEINVGHAGTSFRFLTAFLATRKDGKWKLTGSARMKERPIRVLVDALGEMGAKITYLEKEGYPPLFIEGTTSLKSEVSIDAGVSSQYISALTMVGAKLPGGLKIRLKGELTSLPYLEMTASMMRQVGIDVQLDFAKSTFHVKETEQLTNKQISIEADWSAASYWFSIVALAEIGSEIELKGLHSESRQGDAKVVEYYKKLGVKATFENGKWTLARKGEVAIKVLKLDLSDTPDIAQTLVCTCAGLGVGVDFTGLHTLKIKETDRLSALKNELLKFGIGVVITSDGLQMNEGQILQKPSTSISTYEDHRMAMAFAPLALRTMLSIENEGVVSKSYPDFWKDMSKVINVES